jgi:hypothetical protein
MVNGEGEVKREVRGDSEAVYLVRGSVLSLSFVEPNRRDRPKKPDAPAPRHAPGTVADSILPSLVLVLTVLHSLRSLCLDGTGYADPCLKKWDVAR